MQCCLHCAQQRVGCLQLRLFSSFIVCCSSCAFCLRSLVYSKACIASICIPPDTAGSAPPAFACETCRLSFWKPYILPKALAVCRIPLLAISMSGNDQAGPQWCPIVSFIPKSVEVGSLSWIGHSVNPKSAEAATSSENSSFVTLSVLATQAHCINRFNLITEFQQPRPQADVVSLYVPRRAHGTSRFQKSS